MGNSVIFFLPYVLEMVLISLMPVISNFTFDGFVHSNLFSEIFFLFSFSSSSFRVFIDFLGWGVRKSYTNLKKNF